VLLTIRDAVEPGEFDDVLPQLGREYAALLETARDRLLPHRPRGPDPALAHAPSLDRAACRTVPWSGSTPSAW
jgi:hypothetical protein